MADTTASNTAPWEGFETLEQSQAEDALRAERLTLLIPAIADGLGELFIDSFDVAAANSLRDRLAEGVASGEAPNTLASAMRMREVRTEVLGSLLVAAATIEEPHTLTILKASLVVAPGDLQALTAARIKNQFLADLKRTGLAALPDPLIAFVHGEYEPTSGMFVLHLHALTSKTKALAVRTELRKLKGYASTPTGAPAIVSKSVADPARQVSYLLKSYWPSRAVRLVKGKLKRDRNHRRIIEPYHSLYLLWLDQQRLVDLTIMNQVWSPQAGGAEAMRHFYLQIRA